MKIVITESQRNLLRRIGLIKEAVHLALQKSDPCEYSRFNQYKRIVMNDSISSVIETSQTEFTLSELIKFRDEILPMFEDEIRGYYVRYGEENCPDEPEFVSESYTKHLRRRVDKLEQLIDHLLPQMYTCEYSNGEEFVNGVYGEIYWLIKNKQYGLNEVDTGDVYDYITKVKMDSLVSYWEDVCGNG